MISCGVILAGGQSSRMGVNKSLLPIKDKTVIEHIITRLEQCSDDMIIVTNSSVQYDFLDVKCIRDRYKGKGPLAGMEAAFYHVNTDVFFLAACDMPFIHPKVYNYLFDQLRGHDAVIPVYEDRAHPLSGVYTRQALQPITHLLENNKLRVKDLYEHIDVHFVKDYPGIPDDIVQKHFFNMNDPNDYEIAKLL